MIRYNVDVPDEKSTHKRALYVGYVNIGLYEYKRIKNTKFLRIYVNYS